MTMSRAWTRNETSVPPWAAVAFAAVLTLVGCTDAFAQRALPPPPTGLIVTDVKGAVALAETGGPVAILENLRPGTVLKVPEGAKITSLRGALDRALGNVLRNAVRYAGASGPIRIEVSQQDGQTLVRITDRTDILRIPCDVLRHQVLRMHQIH